MYLRSQQLPNLQAKNLRTGPAEEKETENIEGSSMSLSSLDRDGDDQILTDRCPRFAELDALIAAGFGDTPGDEIPDDAIIPKPIHYPPQWDCNVRTLIRRSASCGNDVEQSLRRSQTTARWKTRQYPPHPHSWRTKGRVPGDGRQKLICRICKRCKIVGDSRIRQRQRLIATLIEEGGLSIRRIAREVGCSKNTVVRTKEYMRAGKL
jgi:hypothetical protein